MVSMDEDFSGTSHVPQSDFEVLYNGVQCTGTMMLFVTLGFVLGLFLGSFRGVVETNVIRVYWCHRGLCFTGEDVFEGGLFLLVST